MKNNAHCVTFHQMLGQSAGTLLLSEMCNLISNHLVNTSTIFFFFLNHLLEFEEIYHQWIYFQPELESCSIHIVRIQSRNMITDWLIGWLIDWLTDWLIDSFIHWLTRVKYNAPFSTKNRWKTFKFTLPPTDWKQEWYMYSQTSLQRLVKWRGEIA